MIINYLSGGTAAKGFHAKLIVHLAFADWILDISMIVGAKLKQNTYFCQVQGFVLTVAALAVVFWSFNIAFSLLESLVLRKPSKEMMDCELLFVIIGWIIPLIFGSVSYFTKKIGITNEW